MKNKLFTVLLVMLLTLSMTALAQSDYRGMGMHRAGRGLFAGQNFLPVRLLLKAKDELGLSGEQVKKINVLVETHEQWAIKFEAEMKIKALKLRSIADEMDIQEAEKLIRDQADMHATMQIARLRLQKELQALLTPDQSAKATKLKDAFRARARDGRGQRAARRQSRRN